MPVRVNRRQFLRLAIAAGVTTLGSASLYARLIEPHQLTVRNVRIGKAPSVRFIQISDIHYRGDRSYLDAVVQRINALKPEFTCITGDFAESVESLGDALESLAGLNAPVFAVPGNWEYRVRLPLRTIEQFCQASGGCFLRNKSVVFRDLAVAGLDDMSNGFPVPDAALRNLGGHKTLLLAHCPMSWTLLGAREVALTIAGHSHGGQVRLPLLGVLWLPRHVGKYVRGYYETSNGPLYVNAGIGTTLLPLRFLCRPEITVIEM